MSNPYAALGINPFEDDVVTEPRGVSFSVTGLNDRPLDRLIAEFAALMAGDVPRKQIGARKAQLVVSPDRGYGKSHLLGRLFLSLGDRATKIYLRPFQDPEKAWNSILLATVQELERPAEHGEREASQFETFAKGVLAHVAADFIANGGVEDYENVRPAIEYLREHPLQVLNPEQPTRFLIDWLRSRLEDPGDLAKLAGLIRSRGVDLQGKERAWLKVLAGYAFAANYSHERDAALKWLRAETLEEEDARLLRLAAADNDAREDASARDINDLSLRRLVDLCAMSAYFRPFVFCFDQTEFYGSDKALIDALGSCVWTQHAVLCNQLTIVTSNASNWSADISPNLKPAYYDRFSLPISLEGMASDQARELIVRRLTDYALDDKAVSHFFQGNWLESQFLTQPQLGVRDLLTRAADRFRLLAQPAATPQKASIEDLFAVEVNKVRAKQALQQYSQDCLMWLAQVLADGFDGITISKPKLRYFSVQWDWPDGAVYFAFEGGDNNARWRAIASEAVGLARQAGKRVTTVVFRTPDLTPIPRPSWGPARLRIEEAVRSGFCIVPLPANAVCELHGARELYSNALQGNIDYAAPDVLGWLKVRFAPWFERLLHLDLDKPPGPATPSAAASTRGSSPDDAVPQKLTKAQFQNVLAYVKRMKLVDIKDVLDRLGRDSLKQDLLRAVEKSPNLKAHPGPQTIYLQWRVSA
jgi:hypothetical protein